MTIQFNGQQLSTKRLGSTKINKIMLGVTEVFPRVVPPIITSVPGGAPVFTQYQAIVPFSFVSTGGVGPYVYTIVAGALPTGITMTTGGYFSGTPTVSGPFNVTFRTTDSQARYSDQEYSGHVVEAAGIWTPYDLFSPTDTGGWWDLDDLGWTDTSLVLGPEVNPSPEFDSATGWFIGSNNTITGGQFVAQNGWSSGQSSYANALVFGKTYFVEFEVVEFTGVGSFQVRMGNAPSVDGYITVAGNGVYRAVLGCKDTNAGSRLAIECTSAAGFSMKMNYLRVKEVLSGYAPVLFQDIAGAFPVTTIEQPMGLVLDKSVGSPTELLVDPNFDMPSEWYETSGTGWTVTGGEAVYANSPAVNSYLNTAVPTMAAGKTYLFKFNVKAATSGYTAMVGGVQMAWLSGVGTKSVVITAGSANQLVTLRSSDCTSLIITDISLQEISPNYYAQATSGARPAWSARKNLLLDTRQYFWSSGVNGWSKVGATVALDQAVSLDGFPLSLLKEDTSTGQHALRFENGGDFVPAGNPRTVSIVAKPAGRTKFYLGTYADPNFCCLVDLVAKTITNNGGNYYNESVTELTDGSFRVMATANSWGYPAVFLSDGSTSSYAGDDTSGILFGEFQINAGTKATKYQPINTASNYDYVDYPKFAKADGVDDRFYAPNLIYYAAFTSIQAQSYGAFDATLDLPVFGSTTPGNGFMTGRRPDKARFKYEVGPAEFQEITSTISLGEPEVLTQGFGSGSRFYRVGSGTIESVVDNFNAGFNTTYLISVAYNVFADYRPYANMSWNGGVYISRELNAAEQDQTVTFLSAQAGVTP